MGEAGESRVPGQPECCERLSRELPGPVARCPAFAQLKLWGSFLAQRTKARAEEGEGLLSARAQRQAEHTKA